MMADTNPYTAQQLGVPGVSLSHGATGIVNAILFLAGIVAVIMIIVGGLKYVTSAGEPKRTASAKETLLYAVIGLVIVLASGAIVNWVLNSLAK